MTPPRLKNDCFALPPGVDWTPVPEALARLRAALSPIVGEERVALADAAGRILASPVTARSAHPPFTNAAVDGYAFAAKGSKPPLPLAKGRAAAGAPYDGTVPPGHALRILTGAAVPQGTDTIVLEEDCEVTGETVNFEDGLKAGANTRLAGEDIRAGDLLLAAGRCLTPGDLALLASAGIGAVALRQRLKVAILSTGHEIVPAGTSLAHGQLFDANSPMLAAIVAAWGHEPIDLGHVPDDPAAVRAALDRGAAEADAIITTGGASAGDEDHVSATLAAHGALSTWRIAIKPGRPLALALWHGKPVFGLPGNPVAAFVCTLLFARPALSLLAGGGWVEPEALTLPAAFEKRKKPGREEYLRARLTHEGQVEIFASEGSGRVTGLSWATGLAALPHGAMTIRPGTPIRYLPFNGMGL